MTAKNFRPHFADIAHELTQGIVSGRFPVGALLPTEIELCSLYRTSRHTVRAALHELQKLGFVSRRKNVGTRVVSALPKSEFRASLASLEDLVQFGASNVRQVKEIGDVVLDGELAELLGVSRGTRCLRISSLRINSNTKQPVGWTDVYVDSRYAEVGKLAGEAPDILISTLIEKRFGRQVQEIHQNLRAVLVPKKLARRLKVAAATPALEIVRQYLDNAGKPFEVSVSVHPTERFAVTTCFQRSNAAE